MWEGQRWKDLVSSPELATSEIMNVPHEGQLDPSNVRDAGVRRGMLHAMMRMMVTQEVREKNES